jgi:hypothetical protein
MPLHGSVRKGEIMTVIQKLFLIIISITMIIGIAHAAEMSLDSGLVAQYLFKGNAVDNTGHGHDGTVYGPIIAPDRFGNPDGAYYFDGRDDYIEVPDDPELKPQSVSLVTWVNIDPAGSQNSRAGYDGYIIFKRNVLTANFEGYQISASPSLIHGTVSSTWGKQVSVYLIPAPGEWHQIAMTADSQYIKMYYDGEFVSEQPTGFPLNYAADNLYFGNSQEWFYKYYHGLIDDVSIYNRILSADEIHTIYSDTAPQTNLPPVLDEIGSKTIDEGQQLTFLLSATDPDPDSTLTYFTTDLPAGASFDTSTRTFLWTPTFAQAGTYTVEFAVSDGTATDSEDVIITVNNVNQKPMAEAGATQTVIAKKPVTFDGSVSIDPDGSIESFVWNYGDGSSSSGVTQIHVFMVPGTFTVTLTVTDNEGADGTDTTTVTVKSSRQSIQDIIDLIKTMNLPKGTENSLVSKLENAIKSVDKNNTNAAESQLIATINEINAQKEKKISGDQVNTLIPLLQEIVQYL